MSANLLNKNIILGITGGIAAYKAAEIARGLVKHGAIVQVVMTSSAQNFITPLTMQALTKRPVRTKLFDCEAEMAMSHIELAKWADLVVIAPASANCIAKIANGMADNLLTTLCLAMSSSRPILLAPAMNTNMWQNKLVQANINNLENIDNYTVLEPIDGELSCGDYGIGKMLEPDHIIAQVIDKLSILSQNQRANISECLNNKKLLITAGPTKEPIDPIRYLSNNSSGKMGYSIANAASDMGFDVTLVSGPVSDKLINNLNSDIKLIQVVTATEMLSSVENNIAEQDIFIGVAAVADYKSKFVAKNKIKKVNNSINLELELNPDILNYISIYKNNNNKELTVIGFAAETENFVTNAKIKLKSKKLDLIILNNINDKTIAFNSDYNRVKAIDRYGNIVDFGRQDKKVLANKLISLIINYIDTKTSNIEINSRVC